MFGGFSPVGAVACGGIDPQTGSKFNCSNADPRRAGQAWGLDGFQTPLTSDCSEQTKIGSLDGNSCFDISGTDYYIEKMRDTARQIVQKGHENLFPTLSYWISLVK